MTGAEASMGMYRLPRGEEMSLEYKGHWFSSGQAIAQSYLRFHFRSEMWYCLLKISENSMMLLTGDTSLNHDVQCTSTSK